MNRFEHIYGNANDLRRLEAEEDLREKDRIVQRIMAFRREYGLIPEEGAVFDVLLGEFNEQVKRVCHIERLKQERKFWLRPPLPHED